MAGCSRHKDSVTSVIVDVTDTMNSKIPIGAISKVSEMHNNLFSRHIVRLHVVNSFEYTPIYDYELPSSNWLKENEYKRMDSLEHFLFHVDNKLNEMYNIDHSLPQSNVFDQVFLEANYLMSIQAEVRTLFISSDLCENNNSFSAYTKDLALMAYNPDSLEVAFTHRVKPVDYTGLQVFLVYSATEENSNNRFIITSAFLRKILLKKHATVSISCNL